MKEITVISCIHFLGETRGVEPCRELRTGMNMFGL